MEADEFKFPTLTEITRSYAFRIVMYGLATAAIFQLLYAGVKRYGVDFMGSEKGPIEWAQFGLVLVAAGCYFYGAAKLPFGRGVLILCAAMLTYAGAREADWVFETWLFEDSYKTLMGAPLFLLACHALWTDRHRVIPDALRLMRYPGATFFAIAGIYLCFVCQLLDRPTMWISPDGVRAHSATKALIEENMELFAYALLVMSGIEVLIVAFQSSKSIATSADTSARMDDLDLEHPDADIRRAA